MRFFLLHRLATRLINNDNSAKADEKSIVPMSPNKKGVMVPDKHWILKTLRNFRFSDPGKPHSDVHPITSDEVSYDVWQKAHAVAIMFEKHAWPDQHLGRRVNDEVELFVQEGSEDVSVAPGSVRLNL